MSGNCKKSFMKQDRATVTTDKKQRQLKWGENFQGISAHSASLVDIKNGLIMSKALLSNVQTQWKEANSVSLTCCSICWNVLPCLIACRLHIPIPPSATAPSSYCKIFHMKHVKHVPLSSSEKKQKTIRQGTFMFHLLLIMNIACAAFLCKNNFSSCLIAHHFLFS